MYDTIKEYYDLGFYSEEDLQVFVNNGWITDEEYSSIVPDQDESQES